MSKWEDKYNELNPKINNMITEQSNKIDTIRRKQAGFTNDVDSKEYKKLRDELSNAKKEKQRLEKLKVNLKQISNIVEYRDRLKRKLNEFKRETERRKDLKQATKKKEELENEITKYQERYEKINKELKEINKKLASSQKEKLNPEQKKQLEVELTKQKGKLEAEKKEITGKMGRTQDERDRKEQALERIGYKTELSNLSQEEIDKQSFDIQNKISKCNFVARNLLEGLSWDSIDIQIDNWKDKKFTAKDNKLADNRKDVNREEEQLAKKDDEPEKDNENAEIDNRIHITEEEVEKIAREQKKLPDLKKVTFLDKHPKIAKIGRAFAKIGRFFKGIGIVFKETFVNENSKRKTSNKHKNKYVEELQDKMQREQIAENVKEIMEDKAIKKEKELSKTELSFKEYIRQIAEKGMNEVEKEQREARQKYAREKLTERQKTNREVEEKKYGKAYADRSRTDEGSR